MFSVGFTSTLARLIRSSVFDNGGTLNELDLFFDFKLIDNLPWEFLIVFDLKTNDHYFL